jgi:hypothetical protein
VMFPFCWFLWGAKPRGSTWNLEEKCQENGFQKDFFLFKTQTQSSIKFIKKTKHERKSRQTTPAPFHI